MLEQQRPLQSAASDGGESSARRTAPSETAAVFDAPDHLRSADTRLTNWLGACLLLCGVIWLNACGALYLVRTGLHVNINYESRWFPASTLVTGILLLLLHRTRSEAVFVMAAVSAVYTLTSCLLAAVVYSVNGVKAATGADMPKVSLNRRGVATYVQLCICIALSSAAAVALVCVLFHRFYALTLWHYRPLTLPFRLKQYLQICSWVQLVLALLSIYVTLQVMAVAKSIITSYMLQELFCSLLLVVTSALQAAAAEKCNKIRLKCILFANFAQFFQELFYGWNAYYLSLYLHSSQFALGGVYSEQVIMTLNFVGHFGRLFAAAYTVWVLLEPCNMRLNGEMQTDYSHRVYQLMAVLATVALLLGCGHVMVDAVYAFTEHIYRRLVAFTGIGVFYANLCGVSLALFVRSRRLVFLAVALVFALLLGSTCLHAVYIFLHASFSRALFESLLERNLGPDAVKASLLHFCEGVLALGGLVLAIALSTVALRILHAESRRELKEHMSAPLYWVKVQAIALLLLNIVELMIFFQVTTQWSAANVTVNYGLLDMLATFVCCALQLFVSAGCNRHIYWPLLVLFVELLVEALFTFNYLSAYTAYVQLLIMMSRMASPSGPATVRARQLPIARLFPVSHLALVLASHAIQFVQWGLVIGSLVACALCLERLGDHVHDIEMQPTTNGRPAAPLNDVEAVYMNMAYESAGPDGNGAVAVAVA